MNVCVRVAITWLQSSKLRVTCFHIYFLFFGLFFLFLSFVPLVARSRRRNVDEARVASVVDVSFRHRAVRVCVCVCVSSVCILILKYIYSVWIFALVYARLLFATNCFSSSTLLHKKRITLVIIGIYSIASRFNEFTKIYRARCRCDLRCDTS